MRPGLSPVPILLLMLCAAGPPPAAVPDRAADAARIRELLNDGRYAEAETAARSLLAETEAEAGADSLPAARAIDLLVETFGRAARGAQPEARRLGEKAVAIKERLLGPGDVDLAISLNNLGAVLRLSGDYPAARAAYERALKIRETRLGPDAPGVAECLGGLAGAMQDAGDLAGALPLHRRALAIRRKALPPDHPDIALGLSNLGIALRNSGDYAEAIAAHQAALAIRERVLPPDHPDTSLTIGNLGVLYYLTGDYASARAMYERVLPMRTRAFGPVNPRVAETLTNMADLARATGDYEQARPLYDRALKMWNDTMGPQHPYTALAEAGFAKLLRATGDLAGAEREFRRALEILRRAVGEEHPLVAINLQNLADALREKGDYAAARPLYERALAIREQAGAPNQPEIATSLAGLADLLRDTGDYAAARPLYERSLEIRRRVLGPRHPRVAENLNELAKISWAGGESSAALALSLDAESILSEHLKVTARTLSEREALRYEAIRESGLDIALSVVASRGRQDVPSGAATAVWDVLVRSRAVVLDELAARHRTVFDLENPGLQPLVRDLDATRETYARLAVRGDPEERPEPYRDALERARDAMEQAERRLARSSVTFHRSERRSRMRLAQVAAGLPPGGALVAFVQYRRYAVSGHGGAPSLARPIPSYLALVRRRDRDAVAAVPLGAAEGIDALVRRWRERVSAPARDARQVADYREAGEALRRTVWDPLQAPLGGARMVFIVPDGSLYNISFATLPTPEDHYLIETGPVIHYLSAERDLARPVSEAGAGRGLLVLGGPDYDAVAGGGSDAGARERSVNISGRAGCADLMSMNFSPLASARFEADELEGLWLKNGRPVLKLTGREAGEGAFKRNAAGHEVLHLATHGFFINGACAPLQLSGLALAGANHRGGSGGPAGEDEDGILTAEEIASLDLRGVKWAVLSACDTGVGPVQTGEGVLGLSRAFEVAGAGTLILSLWEVSDHEARDWVRELYRGRLKGLSTAEAVRDAGLDLIGARRRSGATAHPFYWGAFVAAGDWR